MKSQLSHARFYNQQQQDNSLHPSDSQVGRDSGTLLIWGSQVPFVLHEGVWTTESLHFALYLSHLGALKHIGTLVPPQIDQIRILEAVLSMENSFKFPVCHVYRIKSLPHTLRIIKPGDFQILTH